MADKIRVELEVDPQKGLVVLRDFDRQMEQAVSGTGQSGRAANQAGRDFDALGNKIDVAGRRSESAGALFAKLAGTLGIAFSVQAVAGWANQVHEAHSTYQKDLNMVSTMLDRSSLGQEQYNRLLREYGGGLDDLSVQFGESTRTLSKGLYDILSASVAPGKALEVLRTSSEAARAGFTDTSVAVDFITSALNAYGKSADEAGRVSDIAFATVARGKTTFVELAAAVGRVAPTAAAAGISLEQLMAMLANLTRQGINTNESVTAINALIVQFARGSDAARKAWEQITKGTALAGSEFSVARLRGEELFKTLEVLRNATDSQRMAILQEITAVKAANAMSQDSKGLREDLTKTNNSLGQTEEALGKRAKESGLITDQLNKSWERLIKNLGDEMAPAVDSAKSALKDLIDVANTAIVKGTWGSFFDRLLFGASTPLNLADLDAQVKMLTALRDAAQNNMVNASNVVSSGRGLAGRENTQAGVLGWVNNIASQLGFSATGIDAATVSGLNKQIEALEKLRSELVKQKQAREELAKTMKDMESLGVGLAETDLGQVNRDNTKADLEALAKLDKKLSDEVAKASMDAFGQRGRALDEFVADYVKAGGDVKKIEGDITTLRAANERARVEASNSYWLKLGAVAEKNANEEEARTKKRTDNERSAALLMARYTGDSLTQQAIEHEQFIEEWIAKGATRDKAEALWAAKRVQTEQEAALAMAQYTGDSLTQQAIEHERFVNDWIAKGLERERAEGLWAAKTSQNVGALLTKMGQKWTDYNLIAEETTKTALDGMQGGLHDFIYGGFTGELQNMEDVWEAVWKSMANIAANILSQIGTGLIAKGLGGLFTNLFGATPDSGGGALDLLKSAGASALGSLGFKAASTWLGGTAAEAAISQATMTAINQSAVEMAAAYGAQAAGEFAGTSAAAGAAQSALLNYGGTMAGGEFAGATTGASSAASGAAPSASMAAMFASPAGAMAMAVLPGMVGAIFHDQINSLLGEGGPMTAEEAIGNWAGAREHLEGTAEVLGRIGSALNMVGDSEGYFSQSAIDAYRDFERLATVAGFTGGQLDAIKASLDPVSRGLLESGRIALGVEDDIRSLAKAIAKGREEFDWSKETIDGYQAQIDALAAKYGLTGAAADEFSRKIWDLSETVNSSGQVMVEAGDAVKDVADEVVDSLRLMANEGDGIAALTGATNDLLGSLVGVAAAGRDAASSVSGVNSSGGSKGGGSTVSSVGVGIKHAGGAGRPIYYRHDGWPALGPREYMAILEEPEWVIRSQAVNPKTEPTLRYINSMASLPPAQAQAQAPAPQIVYVTVVTPDGRVLREEMYEDMGHGGGPRPRRLEVRL